MANIRKGKARPGSYHTADQIKKTQNEDYARDDLDRSYAGNENRGPARHEKSAGQETHDTHKKNRKKVVHNQDPSNPD